MRRLWLVAAGGFFFICGASARAADDTAFKLSGRLALGWEAEGVFRDRDLEKEAVLGLETERKSGWKGAVEARLSSADLFELRELFVEYRPKEDDGSRENRLLVGQEKKRFGLEWDQSQEDRIGLERGMLYEQFARLAFVGRDSQIAFRQGDSWAASLHTSDGLNVAALLRLSSLGPEGGWASYSLLQFDRIDHGWPFTLAQALAYSSWTEGLRWQAEGFFGKDTLSTDLEHRRGNDRDVWFAAATGAIALQKKEERSGVAPYARFSLLFTDLGSLGDRVLQGTLGARYSFIDRLHLGAEVSAVRANSRGASSFASESEALLVLRYYFNDRTD
jgi:hypothetical protein